MNRIFRPSLLLILPLALTLGMNASSVSADDSAECDLNFKMENIDGEQVDLEDYEGKVILVVNTASRCGLTPQYAGLEKLYNDYKDKGFVVLAFPCNQFGSQEPGTSSQIKEFCSTKYDVTFPIMNKVEVNGDEAAPIYKQLTSKDLQPAGDGPISWNFEKFLIDREGHAVARFSPRVRPDKPELTKKIEDLL